jgi:hypothetical protein
MGNSYGAMAICRMRMKMHCLRSLQPSQLQQQDVHKLKSGRPRNTICRGVKSCSHLVRHLIGPEHGDATASGTKVHGARRRVQSQSPAQPRVPLRVQIAQHREHSPVLGRVVHVLLELGAAAAAQRERCSEGVTWWPLLSREARRHSKGAENLETPTSGCAG